MVSDIMVGKTVDGIPAANWLYSQPIVKMDGKAGIFLGVIPRYVSDWGEPNRFDIDFFKRTIPKDTIEVGEQFINGATITVKLIDNNQKEVFMKQFTSGASFDFGPGTSKSIPDGVYKIIATSQYQGENYKAENVVIIDRVRQPREKSWLFLGFADENNNPAPLKVAKYFSKKLKSVLQLNNGALVVDVTGQIGKEVEVAFNAFSRKITIPYYGRVALVKVPKALFDQIPETDQKDFSLIENPFTPPVPGSGTQTKTSPDSQSLNRPAAQSMEPTLDEGKCGDAVCDEHEQKDPRLCPKDCQLSGVQKPSVWWNQILSAIKSLFGWFR